MSKSKTTFSFMTRRQVAQTLNVPQRIVDQWIATGVLTPIRMSMGLGRGGQRVFYNADEVKKLKRKQARANKPIRRKPRRVEMQVAPTEPAAPDLV